MNKTFSHILISLCMLGVLLAPISSILLQTHNQKISLAVQLNQAYAQAVTPQQPITTPPSNLYNNLGDCGIFGQASVTGCFVVLAYYIFVSLPSALLGFTAEFFNMMADFSISSDLYTAPFIQTVWQIVRDFANIFFILVLLYAAFQIILDLGHGGGKRIVGYVIIAALLVNFSLFFSKVIIDSSNILALIFYNKITCTTTAGTPCPYGDPNTPNSYTPSVNPASTGIAEKDVATALASRFNVNQFFNASFLQNLPATDKSLDGDTTKLSAATSFSFIAVYGIVTYPVVLVFLLVGLAFLGRLLTLMLLMIVSPLAIVTFSVPEFRKTKTIGFDSWLHEIIKTSFMAAIFMAILYLATFILSSPLWVQGTNGQNSSLLGQIVQIFLPAILIVILLWKGTKYALEASGAFTGAIVAGATMVGGAAIGIASGGTSLALQSTLGAVSRNAANNDKLRDTAANGKGFSKYSAQMKLSAANYGAKASFDARHTGVAKLAQQKSGMNFNNGATKFAGFNAEKTKGGQVAVAKRVEEAQVEKSKLYELSKGAASKQDMAANYEKDKKEAMKEKGESFNEAAFRAAYEKGGDMREHGLNKEVTGGKVDVEGSIKDAAGNILTSKQVNANRRAAYANSLEDKAARRNTLTGFFKDWGDGMKNMVTPGAGLATTAAASLATGGVGAAAVVAIGGLVHALKPTWARTPSSLDPQIIAGVRKGEDPNKHILEQIKKMQGGHGDHEEHDEKEEHGNDSHGPAPKPAAAPSGSGDSHGGGGGDHH